MVQNVHSKLQVLSDDNAYMLASISVEASAATRHLDVVQNYAAGSLGGACAGRPVCQRTLAATFAHLC